MSSIQPQDDRLDSYTKTQPPGWTPGSKRYPLKRYLGLVALWLVTTDLEVEKQGPALAGRLKGRPFNLAMNLQIRLPNGVSLRGIDALRYAGNADLGLDSGAHHL